MRVVGLSGPIGAGKTSLALELESAIGARVVGVSDELRKLARQEGASRAELAATSSRLWSETPNWYVELVRRISGGGDEVVAVVDAVRRRTELEALRDDSRLKLVHVFLYAPPEVLESRFSERSRDVGEYRALTRHPSELELPYLLQASDHQINTGAMLIAEEGVLVAEWLEDLS